MVVKQQINLSTFFRTIHINNECKNPDYKKGIFKNSYNFRLYDCDCNNEYLFVPVAGDGYPYIAVFSAKDLTYIARTSLERFGRHYHELHWCAINPKDGYLYTSDKNVGNDFTNDTSPVMVYSIDWAKIKAGKNDFLNYKTYIKIYTSSGERLKREFVQGGCFDNENHLHIINGDYTVKAGEHNYANEKGGISVFSIPDISSGSKSYYRACRIAYSNQNSGFKYQFTGTGEEPGGITYWDLRNKKVPGKVSGCLHVIMSDNCGKGADDFYFKHFDRTSVNDAYINQHFSKVGVIITAERSQKHTTLNYAERMDEAKRRRKNQDLVAGLYENRHIDYTIIENMPVQSIIALLKTIYSESWTSDTNYIYINCHGYAGGLALGYNDNSQDVDISYERIKNAILDGINGKKVILIDSCHSASATPLRDTNTFVLASSLSDEESKGDSVIGNWATRYWVCGAGKDFLPGAKDDMEADENHDNKVTLYELYTYTNRKLKNNSRRQSCLYISDFPGTVIFE